MYLKLLCLIIFLINNTFHFCEQKEEITLVAEINKQQVYRHSDLSITLTLKNETNRRMLIHKHTSFGYLSKCFDDDYCFEAEKKVNNEFAKMEESAAIDRITGFDSSGVAWNDMYDTLYVRQDIIQGFNINVIILLIVDNIEFVLHFEFLQKITGTSKQSIQIGFILL